MRPSRARMAVLLLPMLLLSAGTSATDPPGGWTSADLLSEARALHSFVEGALALFSLAVGVALLRLAVSSRRPLAATLGFASIASGIFGALHGLSSALPDLGTDDPLAAALARATFPILIATGLALRSALFPSRIPILRRGSVVTGIGLGAGLLLIALHGDADSGTPSRVAVIFESLGLASAAALLATTLAAGLRRAPDAPRNAGLAFVALSAGLAALGGLLGAGADRLTDLLDAGLRFLAVAGACFAAGLHRRSGAPPAMSRDADGSTQFVARISHELRTPLNGVLGFADLLRAEPLRGEQREYVEMIRRSAASAINIISELLDFAKIRSGRMDLDVAPFNLESLAHDACDVVLPMTTQNGSVELVLDIADDVPLALEGDPTRLRQSLVNLLGNAAKFTKTGEILLRVRVENETLGSVLLAFEVIDTGPGIPDADQERIFSAFDQGGAGAARGIGGTGLGLAITRSFARLMGGDLVVESELGAGSTFRLTARFRRGQIPVFSQEMPLDAARRGETVLVIESHPVQQTVLARLLESLGQRPIVMSRPSDAVERFRATPPEATFGFIEITDVPPEDLEAVTALRRRNGSPLLWIALSHRALSEVLEPARRFGIGPLLTKPVRRSRLQRAMRERLEENTSSITPPAPAADLRRSSPRIGPHAEPILNRRGGADASPRTSGTSTAAAVPAVARVLHAPDGPLTRPTILVAEDNEANQALMSAILRKAGYAFEVVPDGLAAVEKVKENRFDLVLMDIQMPVKDGIEATREIRELGYTDLPIIALTANAMRGDAERFLEAGMDVYISKPVRKEELFTVIEKFTRRDNSAAARPASGSSSLSAGGSGFDIDRALDETGLTLEDYIPLLDLFFTSSRDELRSLADATARGDAATATRNAHSVKGAAANMRAEAIRTAAEAAEQAAKRGDLEAVRAGHGRLIALLQDMETAIAARLPR